MLTALLGVPTKSYYVGHMTLHDAVESLHIYLCYVNNWTENGLKADSWSYDNLAHLIYYMNEWCLQRWSMNPQIKFTTKMLQKVVFDAWKDNYIHWRDEKPYTKDKRYTLPKKIPFNPDRDARSTINYGDLCQEQKDKNQPYVDWYYAHLRANARLYHPEILEE